MKKYKLQSHQIQYNKNEYQESRPISETWGPRFLFIILIIGMIGFLVGFKTFLTLSIMFGFVAVVVGLKQPFIGVLGLGILCALDAPMRVFITSGGILRWNTFNYWLLFVMLVFVGDLLKLKHPQIRLLEFFIFVLGLGLIITLDFTAGVLHILNILIIFGLLIYFIRAKMDEQEWYWLGAVTGTISALGSFIYYMQIYSLPYINPNAFAYLPLTGLFAISLGMPFSLSQRQRYLFLWFLAVANFFFVFLSGSRGVTLVAIFCVLFLILEAQTINRRIVFLLLGALLVFSLNSQFTEFQANTIRRFGILLDPAFTLAQRTSGRGDLALGGWHIFLEHPFGVGTGGFAPVWANLGDLSGLLTYRGVGSEVPQHSAWVKTLAENGIPGIVLMIGYVFSFVFIGFRRQAKYLRIIGLMVTTILTLVFLSTNFQGKGIWLLAAGAMVLLQENETV